MLPRFLICFGMTCNRSSGALATKVSWQAAPTRESETICRAHSGSERFHTRRVLIRQFCDKATRCLCKMPRRNHPALTWEGLNA
jgi:hypothetical protein